MAGVDYASDRVLVARNIFVDGEMQGVRFAIFDRSDRVLVADHYEREPLEWSVDRRFLERLTADGRAFFYFTEGRYGPRRIVLRDVRTGKDLSPGPDWLQHGDVLDLVLSTADRGYLVTVQGLHAIEDGAVRRLSVPDAVGRPEKVVDFGHDHLFAVIGSEGWAVRQEDTGRWVAADRGWGVDIRGTDHGWIVIDQSIQSAGVTAFQFVDGRASVARRYSRKEAMFNGAFVCGNAYGVMRYRDRDFEWEPSVPAG